MQSDRLSSRWWRIADNTWILIMKRLVEHDIIQVYHQQDDTAACRPLADNDMIASSSFDHTCEHLGIPLRIVFICHVEGSLFAQIQS